MAKPIDIPEKYTRELERARSAEDTAAIESIEAKIRDFTTQEVSSSDQFKYETQKGLIQDVPGLDVFAEINDLDLGNSSSSKRHILINAFSNSNYTDTTTPLKLASAETRRFITVTATNTSTVLDLEEVVNVTDEAISGTLGDVCTPTISQSTHTFVLEYNDGAYFAQETIIKVTWASGVTKTFEVLVPGINQAIHQNLGSSLKFHDPGATGCSADYYAYYDQKDLATAASPTTDLYFSIKTHDLDPTNLYQDVVGYRQQIQLEDPTQTAANGYATYNTTHISYDTSEPTVSTNYSNHNALTEAHENYGLMGNSWDALAGYDCTNPNLPFQIHNGVDPSTTDEQLHKTITVMAKGYYSTSIGSSAANWNNYAVDSAANGYLTYPNVEAALIAGTAGPTHYHSGLNAQTAAFPDSTLGLSNQSPLPTLTTIEYADNLNCCLGGSTPTTYAICEDPSSPDYYLDSTSTNYGFDCYGTPIPAGVLNGTIAASFVSGPANCCSTDCVSTNFIGNINFTSGVATFGTSDGEIYIGTNSATSTIGTPWGSGSKYLFTLTPPMGVTLTQTTPGAGGSTFTIANCTTTVTSAVSGTHVTMASQSDRITTGMQVSNLSAGIPADTFVGDIITGQIGADSTAGVSKFQLVDLVGNPVYATVAGTNTLTFASGREMIWGSLPANPNSYSACITDSVGCSECQKIWISETPPTSGCTDSDAINYLSTAQTDDGTCLTCNATTGNAENSAATISIDLFSSITTSASVVTNYATSNNDGEFYIDAAVNVLLAGYIVTSTSSYTMTLYNFNSFTDALNNSAGTQVAQQTGITLANGPSHNFTGLSAGYYGCRIEIEDSATGSPPGDDIKLEKCWGWKAELVGAEVCTDPAASNQNTTLNTDLQVPLNSILCTYPCNTWATAYTSNPAPCTIIIILHVQATQGILPYDVNYPNGTELGIVWSYNGTVISGATEITNGYTTSINHITQLDPSYITGDGVYSWVATTNHPSGVTCTTTGSITVTVPICGCTDPLATNYDATANVDDGSCFYPTWNCVNYLCVDPGDGTGMYNNLTDCENNCISPQGGCTDPCAVNYDATATFDDGSCQYSVCLDQAANNYLFSCDCNQQLGMSAITLNDPNCCTYPCVNPAITTVTTTDSTGTCTVPLSDGSVTTTATLNNAAAIFTVVYWNNSMTSIIYTDPTTYTSGDTTAAYSTLAPGVYNAIVTDSQGCETIQQFTIGTVGLTQGCMDPDADNYDPNAVCDDGSCEYSGCTDPLAMNYLPAAASDDGSCKYHTPVNPCVLERKASDRIIDKVTLCLTKRGETYLNKMRTGLIDDCSIMNIWKIILIKYLLESHGRELDCLYNCEDNANTNNSLDSDRCLDAWVQGGPVTGGNDQAHAGSSITTGEGTTITDSSLFFVAGNTLYLGDVIKMPSGNIWQIVAPATSSDFGGYNPETPQGIRAGHWALCPESVFSSTTNTIEAVNYLDNFINFVNEFCADCKTNF